MISRRTFLKSMACAGLISKEMTRYAQTVNQDRPLTNESTGAKKERRKTRCLFIDAFGNVVFEPKFKDHGRFYSEGLNRVMINAIKGGFYNKRGEIVLLSRCADVGNFSDGLAYVQKWSGLSEDGEKGRNYHETGFINKSGRLVIAQSDYQTLYGASVRFAFGDDGGFSEGLARIIVNDKYGYINTTGEIVVEPQFAFAESFSEGLATVHVEGEGVGCINKAGEIVIPPVFNNIFGFEKGSALAERGNEQLCYINAKGEIVLPLHMNWDECLALPDGFPQYCGVRRPGGLRLFRDYDWVGSGFYEGMMLIKRKGKYGFANEEDEIVIPPVYDCACNYANGLAEVQINGRWGFIDRSGQTVVECQYQMVNKYSDGLALVWY